MIIEQDIARKSLIRTTYDRYKDTVTNFSELFNNAPHDLIYLYKDKMVKIK